MGGHPTATKDENGANQTEEFPLVDVAFSQVIRLQPFVFQNILSISAMERGLDDRWHLNDRHWGREQNRRDRSVVLGSQPPRVARHVRVERRVQLRIGDPLVGPQRTVLAETGRIQHRPHSASHGRIRAASRRQKKPKASHTSSLVVGQWPRSPRQRGVRARRDRWYRWLGLQQTVQEAPAGVPAEGVAFIFVSERRNGGRHAAEGEFFQFAQQHFVRTYTSLPWPNG